MAQYLRKRPINIIAEILGIILKKISGTEADFATKAEDAAEKLRESNKSNSPFDLVITDLNLAGEMNGFDLAEIIKKEALCLHVTLLTASAKKISQNSTPAQLKERGVEYLIGKPFGVKEFRNHVEGLINQQKDR